MERVYTTPLLDKLGIRPGMRVAILGVDDATIRSLVADLATRIRPNGAIWVVSRRGKAATLRDIPWVR